RGVAVRVLYAFLAGFSAVLPMGLIPLLSPLPGLLLLPNLLCVLLYNLLALVHDHRVAVFALPIIFLHFILLLVFQDTLSTLLLSLALLLLFYFLFTRRVVSIPRPLALCL